MLLLVLACMLTGVPSVQGERRLALRSAPREAVTVVPNRLRALPVEAEPVMVHVPRFGAGAPETIVVTPEVELGFDPRKEEPALLGREEPARFRILPWRREERTETREPAVPVASGRSAGGLMQRCRVMSRQGLRYQFGSDDPSRGGLDCSGAVQYLLRKEGVRDVPRTADMQFHWLDRVGDLNKVRPWTSSSSVLRSLRPGDLLFWRGTYRSSRRSKITHVMIYAGRDRRTGKHMMFGASSRRSKGVNGNGVDFYEFKYPNPGGKGTFVGYGSVPGLRR